MLEQSAVVTEQRRRGDGRPSSAKAARGGAVVGPSSIWSSHSNSSRQQTSQMNAAGRGRVSISFFLFFSIRTKTTLFWSQLKIKIKFQPLHPAISQFGCHKMIFDVTKVTYNTYSCAISGMSREIMKMDGRDSAECQN